MKITLSVVKTIEPELDPALEDEIFVEPPELRQRLDMEENQESGGLKGSSTDVARTPIKDEKP